METALNIPPIQVLTENRVPEFKLPIGANPHSTLARELRRRWDAEPHPVAPHYVIIMGDQRLTTYRDIRQAKAFRGALAAALADGIHASVATLFAVESAKLADEMNYTDAPDEHFILPAA